ncbi:MAG: DEAD/DEAH box helicase [Chlorobium sp.]|nr:DEAD/DEAH box helicase [Chlorobium sp.]
MSDVVGQRPDVQKILSHLKPFQRDTVEYVFQRMYMDSDATNRFLVADEVGLGKTMVAKGLLAKAIDHLWDTVERIDIVYICSNADIARQNIIRLNLTGNGDAGFASRITLLPIYLDKLQERKLNFISFTPGTSFDMRSSMGVAEERRLLYWMLHEAWSFEDKIGPKNVMQGHVTNAERWRSSLTAKPVFDPELCAGFINFITEHDADEVRIGRIPLRQRFDALCEFLFRLDRKITNEVAVERNRVIGILRRILAKTCLRFLEPDVVIMDEFQRFKKLLSGEDEAGQLAQELFNYSDQHSEVRTLLLSATPYKMYTQYGDQDDDHYQDFLDTIQFLEKKKPLEIEGVLKEFRQELFRCHDGEFEKLLGIKSRLERRLRKVISRKERIAGSVTNDDMLTDKSEERFPVLTTNDVQHYLVLQKIARFLEHGDMIEYWKSAPYLLNFMDGYKVKTQLYAAVDSGETQELAAIIGSVPGVILPWEHVACYGKLPPANPRLQQLLDDIIDNGAWQLLWMPPSLPYYAPSKGPYADFKGTQLTKRLVFSSWNVVPKMIAAMVSYEAERLMFGLFETSPEYSPDWRKKQGTLLKFAGSERLTGMPVLGVLYPCFTLAQLCDPLTLYSESLNHSKDLLSLETVKSSVDAKIKDLLENLAVQENTFSAIDENWYWAAPILLDLQHDKEAADSWLNQEGIDELWSGEEGADEENDDVAGDKETNWSLHVRRAKELQAGTVKLGRRPHDLIQVLTLMALGGPAILALRALCRLTQGRSSQAGLKHRNAAAKIAWGFRSLFNRPEVTCLLRGLDPRVAYWRRIMEYSAEGGLQSVLDEYVHVLQELLGVIDHGETVTLHAVATAVAGSLQLITARIDIDKMDPLVRKKEPMRGHYALRFGTQDSEDSGKESTREDRVRQAFNSPFWPFVLASTSVGQEGLDFHPYCHAIVHWNLPNNPVDMEQREGRVHRYKGHAVRKNLAQTYSHTVADRTFCDPWKSMFAGAVKDHSPASRGMSPFWNFPVEGGARVERHVPALPFSRDQFKLAALRKSLAIYRMVFGQSRQEDLVEYLLKHLSEAEVAPVSELLEIDLSAPIAELGT